jgi:hypothetical protein
MKKIIVFATLLCVVVSYGQRQVAAKIGQLVNQGTEFRQFSPLQVNTAYPSKKVVNNATYASVDLNVVAHIATTQPDNVELSIPYNNSLVTVQLYKVELLAEGFHVDTDKQAFVSFEKGAHYRGIIKNDPLSVTSFNFFSGEMNGIISGAQYSNIVVGKLQAQGNTSDYIVYSDAMLTIPNTFTCSTAEPDNDELHQKSGQSTNSLRCVTVYFEMDHDLYLANGSDVVQTNNWMASVFNNVQTLFANDGITTALKSVFVWTTPDPYSGDDSSDYLFQFNEVRPVFDGDIGQLVGIDEDGLGGVAIDVAGICSDNNFSYSDVDFDFETEPMFSWTVQVITHELGHLFGSPHTHGCHWNGNNTAIDGCGSSVGFVEGECEIGPIPSETEQGTIMSYCHLVPFVGVSLANGFGPQPAARMLNHIESSMCLSTNCVNTCINTVATITTTSASDTSATITWDDEISTGPWLVAVAPATENFTTWQGTFVNTFTFTDLDPNTYYKFGVRPVCADPAVTGTTNELVFATSGDYCSGLQFTDTGGAFGDYEINQYLVRTITPNVAGAKAVVTFLTFDIEADFDFMFVYDGPDTSAPLLGMFTGTDMPGTFQSTAPDGSLTFEFISDQFIEGPGWVANVSCANLSIDENIFTDFRYYPNPANNIVNISAGEEIKEIFIHNVAGQLLLHKTINANETMVDISAFAEGVYFFRASSENKEINFRIIKE